MLKNLQVRGTANCVKNCHLPEVLELQLSTFGINRILLPNVDYVVAVLVLLESVPMVNGFMPFVPRLKLFLLVANMHVIFLFNVPTDGDLIFLFCHFLVGPRIEVQKRTSKFC